VEAPWFAFYGWVSTEDWQDPVTSRARQLDQAAALPNILRLDYCGRLVGEAHRRPEVRGAGIFAGAMRSGALWLAASLCAPLVGGRAERSGLAGLAWAGAAGGESP
jgi:hypothetical protein